MDSTKIMKPLFAFYILTLVGHTNELPNKRMTEFIKSNRLMQHLIGLLAMIVLVTLYGVTDMDKIITYACIGYFMFVVSTKTNVYVNTFILASLLVGYLYEIECDKETCVIENDASLDNNNKISICDKYRKNITYIWTGITTIIFIGAVFYALKKSVKYENDYDLSKFFFNKKLKLKNDWMV